MKSHPNILAMLCFVFFCSSIIASKSAGQETVKVVFPNFLENVEGNDAAGFGEVFSSEGMRYQLVFDASQFASLPDTHFLLKAMLSRPDGAITEPFSFPEANLLVRLSVTSRNPGQLSPNFVANIGARETVVFEGPHISASANTGPVGGPKDFDYGLQFPTPFFYDPSEGNLLFDLTVFGDVFEVGQDVHTSPDNPAEWVFAGQSDARSATGRGRGIGVNQFVFVPEPSSFVTTVVLFRALLFAASTRKD